MTEHTLGRWVLDVSVVVALVSAAVAGFTTGWEAAGRFAAITVAMLFARRAAVPAPFAGSFAVFLFVATWASVRHWYRDIENIDLVVHFLTPGSLAAVAYFTLVSNRWLPPAPAGTRLRSTAPVMWVTMVGVTAAVLWEFYEWVVEQFAPATMLVGYTDTVGDLLAGLLGSMTAGALVLLWARGNRRRSPSQRKATATVSVHGR